MSRSTPSDRPAPDTTSSPVVAFFDLPYAESLPKLAEAVTAMGMRVTEDAEGALVQLSRGDIRITGEGARTRIALTQKDAIGGQVLRDLLDRLADRVGLTLVWAQELPRGRPANLSLTQVRAVRRISPAFVRVEVAGPDLARFAEGPLHFTLPQSDTQDDWPYTDAGGVTRWPGEMSDWHRPVFTTRSLRADGEDTVLTFDVFLHDAGRTPDMVRALRTGDELAIMGPSGSARPKPTAYLGIVADETAVPVAARILAESADTIQGTVCLVVPSAADIQEIAAPPGVSIQWLSREDGETPLTALDRLQIPQTDRFVLFAAEKSEAAEAKDRLSGMGLVRGEFLAASYWSAG